MTVYKQLQVQGPIDALVSSYTAWSSVLAKMGIMSEPGSSHRLVSPTIVVLGLCSL
jgi:hypothetical protein